MKIIHFCVIYCIIYEGELAPVEQNIARNLGEDENTIQGRAGLTDIFNPGKIEENTGQTPLQNLQNFFRPNTTANSHNNNFLNNVKLFFVTVEGAIMPASAISGGITNFLQRLVQMGNVFGNLGKEVGLDPFKKIDT